MTTHETPSPADPAAFREALIQLADETTRPIHDHRFVATVNEALAHVADPEERNRLHEKLVGDAAAWAADAVTVAVDLTLTATEQRCRLGKEARL